MSFAHKKNTFAHKDGTLRYSKNISVTVMSRLCHENVISSVIYNVKYSTKFV